MVALGYVYTFWKQTLRSSEYCTSQNATSLNATSDEFLELQILPCIVIMTGICRCPVLSARNVQKLNLGHS